MADSITIDGKHLSIFDVVHVARDRHPVTLAPACRKRVEKGRQVLEASLKKGAEAYGVTTGVGSQKLYSLAPTEVATFNQRLLVAHGTVATDETYSPEVVRAAILVQLNGFSTGKSAVRWEIVEALLERLEDNWIPTVSAGGTVGASDLVPLAQMGLPLIGIAHPTDQERGEKLPTKRISLEAKEGLSLINSNAISLGHGALTLLKARKVIRGFDLAASLSYEGFRSNLGILADAVMEAHPEPGQMVATNHLRRLLSGSHLFEEGQARFLQDPLSFRCVPQVHGAVYSVLEYTWKNWELEMNTVQDNPVVDEKRECLVSHGNMDSTLLTLTLDSLRSAIATMVGISTQRLHKLHWPQFSGLPSGLADRQGPLGGVQFLNLSHIAESYVARVRASAQPALLNYQGQLADGVEDHATLLPLSLSETERLLESAWIVQALEITIAVWAIRRRQIPVSSLGAGIRDVYERIEPLLPIGREGSEVFDLRPIVHLVKAEQIVDLIDDEAPPVPEFPKL